MFNSCLPEITILITLFENGKNLKTAQRRKNKTNVVHSTSAVRKSGRCCSKGICRNNECIIARSSKIDQAACSHSGFICCWKIRNS